MIATVIKVGDTYNSASDTIVPTKCHIGRRIVLCLSYFTAASSGCVYYAGEKEIEILTTKVGGAFIMRARPLHK